MVKTIGLVLYEREVASFALAGLSSSDNVTKIPYGVDVLSHQAGRWMLAVAEFNADAFPFSAFSDLACHLEDTWIGVLEIHCASW